MAKGEQNAGEEGRTAGQRAAAYRGAERILNTRGAQVVYMEVRSLREIENRRW